MKKRDNLITNLMVIIGILIIRSMIVVIKFFTNEKNINTLLSIMSILIVYLIEEYKHQEEILFIIYFSYSSLIFLLMSIYTKQYTKKIANLKIISDFILQVMIVLIIIFKINHILLYFIVPLFIVKMWLDKNIEK